MCLGLVDTTEWKYLEEGGVNHGYQAFPFLSAKPQEMRLAFLGRCQAFLCILHREIINTNSLYVILLSACITVKLDMG